METEHFNVLIVDDVMSNIQVIGSILRKNNLNTYAALSGKQALNIAADTPLDLILLDIAMPEMDGYEICRHLKANEKTAAIPVIFLTARAQAEDVAKGFELGAVDYITKPFNSIELVKRVFNHLQLKRAQDTIARQNTRLEEQNIRLQEINASKDKLFSIIAHDLKNPFNALLSFTRFLKENYHQLQEEKHLKYISLIQQSANNGYKLLENLLNWARAQTDRLQNNPEHLFLRPTVKEVSEFYKTSFKDKQLQLINEVPADLKAFVDKNILMTILRNLLSNAHKFSYPGGKVIITAMQHAGETSVAVTDYGTGMPREKQEKLFVIEENVSEKGTDNEQGTGLGLITAREFAEKAGGTIEVQSQEGKGTTIFIHLPASSA